MSEKEWLLITGISGFIAQHVAIKALEEGYFVKGTVRSLKRAEEVRKVLLNHVPHAEARLQFVEADLTSDKGWEDAVDGCRYILHVASPFPLKQPEDRFALVPEAKEGTLRVLRAAAKAKVDHVVLTSSIASIIYRDGPPGDMYFTEQDWADENATHTTSYNVSKVMAEKAAWHFVEHEAPDLKLTTLCPGFVMGPIVDVKTGTSAQTVADMMKGKFPVVPRVGFMTVDVRDVAIAHIKALETEAAIGERFALVSDYLTFMDFGTILKEKFPSFAKNMPKLQLPDFAVRMLARFDASIASVVPGLGVRRYVSNEKAKKVLKMDFRSGREAVEDMGQSLVDHGLL